MPVAIQNKPAASSVAVWGSLPERVRVLFVTTPDRIGGWLAEALACDTAMTVLLEEAAGAAEGLARLRDEAFDAVLVSHEPELLDALEFTAALRGGGAEEPVVILGTTGEQEMTPLVYECGADGYVCAATGTTRGLLWVVARAVERSLLLKQTRRLELAERQRLQQAQQEARRLLDEQRAMLQGLLAIEPSPLAGEGRVRGKLPDGLSTHYRDLLRAYVIMGSGNLGHEMRQLAAVLAAENFSAAEALSLHVQALDDLLRGLGNRSARHVMSRANLLALDLLLNLVENYRPNTL